MKNSIKKFLQMYKKDKIIYSGHGEPTTVKEALNFLPKWQHHI